MKSRQWIALFALSLPMIALSVDMNGVVVLLPQFGRDLGVGSASTGAVVTVASLAFAAPLLLIGRIADRVGARPLLLGGVAGFAAASALCAAADSFGLLVAGRALQGVASACCFTTSLAAIDAMFEGDQQPIAVGIWGALGGIGGAAGPLVASVLANLWSWRAFFGVNVVLLALAFVLLAAMVPSLPADRDRTVPIVPLGALALGVACAVGGIQHAASNGWGAVGTIVPIGLGVAVLVAVVRRHYDTPLIPSVVTASASFRLGTTEATLSNWGSGVVMVLVPTALQVVRHESVLGTGLLFLGFSVPFALGGAASGLLIRARGAPSTLAMGLLGLAAGMAGLAAVGPEGSLVLVIATLAVAGLGNGIVYSAATSHALVDIAPVDAGEASAVLSMSRVLGLVLAVALSTSLMQAIDDANGHGSSPGLRVALVLAAVITVVGIPLARRAGRAVVSPRSEGALEARK